MHTMRDPKPQREEDETYLDYIRRQPCVVCFAPSDDPHHLDHQGNGGSDYTAIPLCRGHHTEIHKGQQELARRRNIDFWEEAHKLLRRYFSQTENPMR